ncbi:ABC transporter ATP-binding protein [Halalkalibacter krulwichiae]|uniref:ABC-type transporter ATP-binding protein EcsA n=1 Tax=Halalkalibacter krulwichiae TaxID=199441 RepID=A0A1X9M914_9BACI|nr:ABC transporter ATP-binding protein [Halalkalibacter krulwichiae]ARK29174.1 ABC-type transporter ATP-binding protein EcsA [Halalkalibacter krulwichiae]
MDAEVLKIKELTGGYHPKKPVLHNINFSVRKEEIVGLIGLNGAGKSTTIKHILGLLQSEKGYVSINEMTYQDNLNEYRRSYAYIPETPILYDELTLWEHLELTALAYGLEKDLFEQRANRLLEEFRMQKMKKWYPSHFSKGMRQKVMIMSAFLIEPPVYIVDEPIVGLDPIGIQSFLTFLSDMRKKGAAILMSTHILATAERYCDRFVILHQGRVVLEGTLEEMRQKTKLPNATLDDIYIEMTKEELV